MKSSLVSTIVLTKCGIRLRFPMALPLSPLCSAMEKAQQRLHRKLRRITSLSRLSFDLTEVPEDVKGDTSMGKDRGDIIGLALEYVQAGLPGDNWISVSNSKDREEDLWSQPAFSTAPAVVEGRLYTTAPSTFRLDYFSANILLDSILEQFGK